MMGMYDVDVKKAFKDKEKELKEAKDLLRTVQHYICWNEMTGARARMIEEEWESVMGENPRE